MKFQLKIDIERPIVQVIALFDNTENLKEWQPGFQSYEHLSGKLGEVGAQSKLVYLMGKRECEMVETITVKDLPKEFTATYDADGFWNEIKNQFVEIGENQTRWISDTECKSDKFMIKVMMFLMPSMFKKESFKFMQNFKKFVEEK